MTSLLSHSLRTLEGAVRRVETDGHVVVGVDGGALRCRLLETAAGPPLRLEPGDCVLVAAGAAAPGDEAPGDEAPGDEASGFVLGRIALHPLEAPVEAPGGAPADGTSEAPDDRTVHVVMPAGVETVRIAGTRVRIAAEEELTLECGGASVRIDRRGKVVVLGTDVTTRARRLHKIKGASVAIN